MDSKIVIVCTVLLTLQWMLGCYIFFTLFLFVNILNIYWLCRSYQHAKQVTIFNAELSAVHNQEQTGTIFMMMEMIKEHPKYKIMQDHKPLTHRELMGLIVYTFSQRYCRQMKKSQNEWYCDASNAVSKIHAVLHYKSDQRQPKMLFHGSGNPSLDQFSQEELFLKTFCSFTTECSVAHKFATGSILVITGVDEKLRSGQLKGANVSWISPYDEEEWIILPTTFHNWREMSKQEIVGHGWRIRDGIKVYITNDYISNINALAGFSDIMSPNYALQNETNRWFHNQLGLKKIDSMKYINMFIENGYDTFELIRQIQSIEDLKQIGIVKIGHVNMILKNIKGLDEYLNRKQNEQIMDVLPELMDDLNNAAEKQNFLMMRNLFYFRSRTRENETICKCEWIHHDTIPTNQFGPISEEDRQHIAIFHPDLHLRLLNQ